MRDDPNVKELKPLREGLREMMQCDGRQHFAESSGLHEHPRRPSSWKDSTRMEFMKIQMEYFKEAIRIEEIDVEDNGCFSLTVGESN